MRVFGSLLLSPSEYQFVWWQVELELAILQLGSDVSIIPARLKQPRAKKDIYSAEKR
jgi:hypothetical protein